MTRMDVALKAGIAGAVLMVAVKLSNVFLLFTCGFLQLDETFSVMAADTLMLLLFMFVCLCTGVLTVWLSEGRSLARGHGARSLVKAGVIAGTTYAVLHAIIAIPAAIRVLLGYHTIFYSLGAMTRIFIVNPIFYLLACIVLVLISGLVFNAIAVHDNSR